MPRLLNRLEVNGFKSFAQKTVFDFSHGITAIVGPNGSGKSNIIDAIRWLLGEREAKNLRGGKGEDLIFAGTAKRPRLSQAQASLHFENKNKYFSVDFPEITVTRQVSRDGVNQYYLNKAEIRLKDLIDFFARARLGSRGLTVITQGNSDVFIRVAPTERREMIEEMIGLREYQLKKSEAERRLKNTQINLDKVKALTEEILPHLRSLKRQTGRWERRSALEEELRNLENGVFGAEWKEIERELMNVEKELKAKETEKASLLDRRKAAEERMKKVEASEPEERKEIQVIKKRTQALLEERSSLQKEIGRLEVQVEMARARPGTAAGPSTASLLSLLKTIREKLGDLPDMDHEDLQITIEEIRSDIEAVLEEKAGEEEGEAAPFGVEPRPESNSGREREIPSGLRTELTKVMATLHRMEEEISELKEKEKQFEKNQESFYSEFKAAVAAFEAAKDAVERWEREHQEKRFERERLELRRSEWERQIEQAGRKAEEFMKATSDMGNATWEKHGRAELERRMFKLRGDLASIGEVDAALIKEAHETEDRYKFLSKESEDLDKAKNDLRLLIGDLQAKIKVEFNEAMHKINEEFAKFFTLMFGGGTAKLKLAKGKELIATNDDGTKDKKMPEVEIKDAVRIENGEAEEPEEGIEIDLKLPRKRITSLGMLSGGERSLVGIAALFALISVSPPPFLVLDEIDAALDESNARRFSELLKEFSKQTQFIIVTHNRATMEAADVLYGVTLNDDETSKIVSLKLEPRS